MPKKKRLSSKKENVSVLRKDMYKKLNMIENFEKSKPSEYYSSKKVCSKYDKKRKYLLKQYHVSLNKYLSACQNSSK